MAVTVFEITDCFPFQIPFGLDNPRKITHQPLLNAFGVAFVYTEPAEIGAHEVRKSFFSLLDDASFEGMFLPFFPSPSLTHTTGSARKV